MRSAVPPDSWAYPTPKLLLANEVVPHQLDRFGPGLVDLEVSMPHTTTRADKRVLKRVVAFAFTFYLLESFHIIKQHLKYTHNVSQSV
jgi:hypothetical protein